jgi:hypothetical protein
MLALSLSPCLLSGSPLPRVLGWAREDRHGPAQDRLGLHMAWLGSHTAWLSHGPTRPGPHSGPALTTGTHTPAP